MRRRAAVCCCVYATSACVARLEPVNTPLTRCFCALRVGGRGGVAGEGRAPGLLLALIESGQTDGCSLSCLLLFL